MATEPTDTDQLLETVQGHIVWLRSRPMVETRGSADYLERLAAALREARAEVAFHADGYEVIVQALIDHGGFPEVDGDGDEAGIIADHVRGLALERDAFQAAANEAANERDALRAKLDAAADYVTDGNDALLAQCDETERLRVLLADAVGVVREAATRCRSAVTMDPVADDLDALSDRLAADHGAGSQETQPVALRCGWCCHWESGQRTKEQVAEWLRVHRNATLGPYDGVRELVSTCPHPCGTPRLAAPNDKETT